MYDSKVKLLYVFATNDKALEKFKKTKFYLRYVRLLQRIST